MDSSKLYKAAESSAVEENVTPAEAPIRYEIPITSAIQKLMVFADADCAQSNRLFGQSQEVAMIHVDHVLVSQ